MAAIACVANISEGRRQAIVDACATAIRQTAGVTLLDCSSDRSHNRSVLTMAGDGPALKQAVLALYETALPRIDLRCHQGEHPRLGAVDVVPFVPVGDTAMTTCVALAREVAEAVATRFDVPVYLYEEAAANPARRNLEDVRRGEFEGLAAKMARDEWWPDFGPARPHPSAGASVMGARLPLIAFNVTLSTDRIDVAKKIASAVRFSDGGLRFVKALGLRIADRNLVQVSMNLTDYSKTPLFRAFDLVKREATRYGVTLVESEIVGLVPSAALFDAARYFLQLERFDEDQVLETRIGRALR